jgi:hypothetical protein
LKAAFFLKLTRGTPAAGNGDNVHCVKPPAPQEKLAASPLLDYRNTIMTMKTTRAVFLAASALLGAMALDPVSGFNAASAAECNQNTAKIDGHRVACDVETGTIISEEWLNKDFQRDRADGPAYIRRDAATGTVTCEVWHKNGALDRADGPAYIERNAATSILTREGWYKDDKLDRADGPAIILRDAATGTVIYEAWYRDGQRIAPPSAAAKPAPAPG